MTSRRECTTTTNVGNVLSALDLGSWRSASSTQEFTPLEAMMVVESFRRYEVQQLIGRGSLASPLSMPQPVRLPRAVRGGRS